MRRTTLAAMVALLPIATLTAQQRTVNVGNAVINHEISGKGKTVVFIHGWAHNLSVWDDQVPALKSRYRVLRYDSPGFGRSTGVSDESAEPRDLLVLMETLHIDHAYIVGHSRGGGVALR
ncbi:MAG: alpha/beta fold hydrolase, partial [Gemmatimonadaceae bacterium]